MVSKSPRPAPFTKLICCYFLIYFHFQFSLQYVANKAILKQFYPRVLYVCTVVS
jgi:hypothetical protein